MSNLDMVQHLENDIDDNTFNRKWQTHNIYKDYCVIIYLEETHKNVLHVFQKGRSSQSSESL
jgi:hypothetical protein